MSSPAGARTLVIRAMIRRIMNTLDNLVKYSMNPDLGRADFMNVQYLLTDLNNTVLEFVNAATSTVGVEYTSTRAVMAMLDELINSYSKVFTQAYDTALRGAYGECPTCASELGPMVRDLFAIVNTIIMKVQVLYPSKERIEELPSEVVMPPSFDEDTMRVLATLMSRGSLTKSEVAALVGSAEKASAVIDNLVNSGFAIKVYNPVEHYVEIKIRPSAVARLIEGGRK